MLDTVHWGAVGDKIMYTGVLWGDKIMYTGGLWGIR